MHKFPRRFPLNLCHSIRTFPPFVEIGRRKTSEKVAFNVARSSESKILMGMFSDCVRIILGKFYDYIHSMKNMKHQTLLECIVSETHPMSAFELKYLR